MNRVTIAAIISLVAFILSAIGYVSLDEERDQQLQLIIESCDCEKDPNSDCDLFSAEWNNGTHYMNNAYCEMLEIQENEEKILFGDLTCDEIAYANIVGLRYSQNDTTFSQQRIIDCLKEVENRDPIEKTPKERVEESISKYADMSCDEIITESYTATQIEQKSLRKIVREKVSSCMDKHELPYRDMHPSTVLLAGQIHQKFYTEDALSNLLSGIHKNINIDKKYQLSDINQKYQHEYCEFYVGTLGNTVPACDDVKTYSQPFHHVMSIEEVYQKLYLNEIKAYYDTPCSELEKYDGKMHRLHWKLPFVTNALKACKDN